MAESKPRKQIRKSKIEKLAEEPSMPIRRAAASRKSVRRLPPSPGMDDIALPKDLLQNTESEETPDTNLLHENVDQHIEEEDYLSIQESHVEQTNKAQSAVSAENVHKTLDTQTQTSGEKTESVFDHSQKSQNNFNGKIEAKSWHNSEPFLSREDANFLAPEYNSFGLSAKKSRGGFTTFIIWLLVILIIVGIISLVLLYIYPSQTSQWYNTAKSKITQEINSIKHDLSGGNQSVTQTSPIQQAIPVSKIQFRTASASQALAAAVDTSMQSQYSDYQIVSNADSSEVSNLNLTTDTLLYKPSEQSQAQDVSGFLAQNFGLQMQLQESSNLQEDLLLYLTPTIANPNLNGESTVVYNANGKPGAAKTYCQTLISYKASSCTPSNSKTQAQGMQISYKNIQAMFVLARTSSFSSATFVQAPPSQQEDLVVTLGK